MGYNTDFKGKLTFEQPLTGEQIAALNNILNEDCRDHPEWKCPKHLTYIDLQLTRNFDGLVWNGSEKTYDMTEKINLVTSLMREKWPNFKLKGKMDATGEEGERWSIVFDKNGIARETSIK